MNYSSFFDRERVYGYADDFERLARCIFALKMVFKVMIYISPRQHSNILIKYFGYAFRFSYFSRASLDYILKSGKRPDVLHIRNWETAIVAPLFCDIFVKQVGLGGDP